MKVTLKGYEPARRTSIEVGGRVIYLEIVTKHGTLYKLAIEVLDEDFKDDVLQLMFRATSQPNREPTAYQMQGSYNLKTSGDTTVRMTKKDEYSLPTIWVEYYKFWRGPGYRGEYQCPHGVGHGRHIHSCDGCCKRWDFPLSDANLEATKAKETKHDDVFKSGQR